jgi:virginiamycin B lyase
MMGLAFLVLVFQIAAVPAQAKKMSGAALTGQVSSKEEGAMEGVVVSAKREGSTIMVSVVTDKQGRYSFPSDRLDPGHYAVTIRAVGYDLDGPSAAEVAGSKTATADLKLSKTKDLAAQLSNAEWIMSVPGTDNQKEELLGCLTCHTLVRPLTSTHTADEFTHVIVRMLGYASGSQPSAPQVRQNAVERAGSPEKYREFANYLASVNLSSGERKYELKTLPRPTGRATHVIVTEYDLPRRGAMPHDVIVDEHGIAWYTDFGKQFIGKLDPKTGKVTDYPVPVAKPEAPTGLLEIEEAKDGKFWLGLTYNGAIASFDPKNGEFRVYPAPPELNDKAIQLNVVTSNPEVDGKVWTANNANGDVYRIDINSGKYEKFQPLKELGANRSGIYGINSDPQNNLYFLDIQGSHIGRIDAETGAVKFWPVPTPGARPRRGTMDPNGMYWFGEFGGNKFGGFDTKTEKFVEWPVPSPWSDPYMVAYAKNGELWAGSMQMDRIARLNQKTGEVVEYLLPKETNIRRVFVDTSTTPPTFWTGSNHGAAIVKVEPLD